MPNTILFILYFGKAKISTNQALNIFHINYGLFQYLQDHFTLRFFPGKRDHIISPLAHFADKTA